MSCKIRGKVQAHYLILLLRFSSRVILMIHNQIEKHLTTEQSTVFLGRGYRKIIFGDFFRLKNIYKTCPLTVIFLQVPSRVRKARPGVTFGGEP